MPRLPFRIALFLSSYAPLLGLLAWTNRGKLDPPVLYAWIASMEEHSDNWSWPEERTSTQAGITRLALIHDEVAKDEVDTIYYDRAAGRAFRVVNGQTVYYRNTLGTKISASFLESLSPHNENCTGLRKNSDYPPVN